MSDVDGVEVFVVGRPLHEDLVVEVVQVLGHKDVNVAHDLQDIQTLNKQENSSIRIAGYVVRALPVLNHFHFKTSFSSSDNHKSMDGILQ